MQTSAHCPRDHQGYEAERTPVNRTNDSPNVLHNNMEKYVCCFASRALLSFAWLPDDRPFKLSIAIANAALLIIQIATRRVRNVRFLSFGRRKVK